MTDPPVPTAGSTGGADQGGPDRVDELLADEPLDDLDAVILAAVRDGFAELDPPPADLDERSRFAIRTDLDAELSVLLEDESTLATTRDGNPARTLTFESPGATVMVTVSGDEGRTRLDGWIAPPAPCPLTVRVSDGTEPGGVVLHAVADRSGRFVVDGLSGAFAQLTVQPAEGGPPTTVTTAPFRLTVPGIADG